VHRGTVGDASVYLDGKVVGTAPITYNPVPSPETMLIGSSHLAIGAQDDPYFGGSIDDVRIYERALDPAEIKALADEGQQKVSIDIKPGSVVNAINPRSNGVIPVAVLSTQTFEATTVNPSSVRFGPGGARDAHTEGYIEDVNHDGKPDVVFHFRTQATGIKCGDASAFLTGQTLDGQAITGSDSIKTVGCNHH
jgi:concanavalin A-like lectin/glucanase superfamily protein